MNLNQLKEKHNATAYDQINNNEYIKTFYNDQGAW